MTTRLNHESRNRIEKVKALGAYERGSDASPQVEYLSEEDEKLLMRRIKRESRKDNWPAFLTTFQRLINSLRLGPQKVAFRMFELHCGAKIRKSKSNDGEEILHLELAFDEGESKEMKERMLIVLETVLLTQKEIIIPLANARRQENGG